MADVRDLLGEALRGVEPAGDDYLRLHERANRRERRRRVVTTVVGLTIAVSGLLVVVTTFGHLGTGRRPATAVETPPPDLDRLELAWTATVQSEQSFPPVELVEAEGILVVPLESGLVAIAKDCGEASSTCEPAWTAAFNARVGTGVSTEDGVVYAGSNEGLLAFQAGCSDPCEPVWRGALPDGAHGAFDPVVAGDVVKVWHGAGDGPGHTVQATAFQVACGTEGSVCQPLWTGAVGTGTAYSPTPVAAGIFFQQVGDRVVGFDATCGTDGAPCEPSFVWTVGGQDVLGPVEGSGELLWSSSDGSVYAFPIRCAEFPCQPLWVGRTPGYVDGHPVVAGEQVTVTQGNTVFAFPLGCRSDGGECPPAWTGVLEDTRYAPVRAADERFVIAADHLSDEGEVWAFPSECADACTPAWTASVDARLGAVEIVGDTLLVGTHDGMVLGFPLDCRTDGGRCRPTLVWEVPGGRVVQIVADSLGIYILSWGKGEPILQPVHVTAFRA